MKTIPPLRTRRARRGVAPRQKARTPSSRRVVVTQFRVPVYRVRASRDCMRVLITLCRGKRRVSEAERSGVEWRGQINLLEWHGCVWEKKQKVSAAVEIRGQGEEESGGCGVTYRR